MATRLFVNGTHLILAGITGSAGDKNGVAKIDVRVNVPDIVTALTLQPGDVATAIGIGGLVCIDRPFSQDADGEFTVTFQFEGFNASFTFDQAKAQNLVQLSWKPSKVQDPLQTHPHFAQFEQTYGPLADDKFPPTYTPKAGDGSPGFSQGAGKSLPNPFLGTDSWIKYGGTFSRTYACTELPESLWENIGVLIDYPPDAEQLNIPHYSNRKWLREAPDIDQNGSALRVTENYLLTGITNGAEAIIYAEAQLTAKG